MRVAIVSCFETYQNRVDDMEKYYLSKKFDVTIVKSNFLHFKKEKVEDVDKGENEILISVPVYNKNISIQRIFSHYRFAKKSAKFFESEEFDLLHVLVPPNYLCKSLSKLSYKPKIIYDIIDFWPETMPINRISKLSIYQKWQDLRNIYIKQSDYIVTECDLFKDELSKTIGQKKIETIYFTRKPQYRKSFYQENSKSINLVYLGSINNIIDIDLIVSILVAVNKKEKVKFHIIGDGENKCRLLELLVKNNIEYIDYGLIYDSTRKMEIFNLCAFAFNIMKTSVFVGLTMKSLDYAQFGIPIINNIMHDTNKLVEKYDIGLNVGKDANLDELSDKIIKNAQFTENNNLRKNVKKMFENEFLFSGLEKKMNLVLNDVLE